MGTVSQAVIAASGIALIVAAAVLAYGAKGWFTVSAVAPPESRAELGVLRYAPGSAQLSAIKVKPVEVFPVPLAEPLNGRVVFNETSTARVSSPISGRIVALKAQAGDAVGAGDALAVLDSPDLAAAVADLRKAEADEVRKSSALERARTLYEGQVLAKKELESAQADFVQAGAETRRAALRLRNLVPAGAMQDNRYVLHAPISGVVADRQANPGMEVRPDLPNPLYVITDPAKLWVLIDLPERDLSKVAPGQPVSIEVDAWPGERFQARIDRIGVVVDAATRRVPVRCAVANPEGKLKPEMYARVTLLADENLRAIRVPNTALVTEGLYSYVFVERSPGVFARRRVALGVQDRDYSYLESGIDAGARVVVAGSVLLNSELESGQ
jgi:cobalt-zinc-cadmium efflux system membrane fusion protein